MMPEHDTCPMCNSAAWPTWRNHDAYAAECGTTWSRDDVLQSAVCRTIMRLRFDADLAVLLRETA